MGAAGTSINSVNADTRSDRMECFGLDLCRFSYCVDPFPFQTGSWGRKTGVFGFCHSHDVSILMISQQNELLNITIDIYSSLLSKIAYK